MTPTPIPLRLRQAALALALALGLAPAAGAATFTFAVNPLAGAPGVDPNDGVRQVVGAAEVTLPAFNQGVDVFALRLDAFGVAAPIAFVSAGVAGLPAGGVNVVVLRDTDNDANPATPFNAGTAANLIASAINVAGPGFFIYSNSGLGVNRLVFSSDLSLPTGDLAILARIATPTGAGAVAALPGFTAPNFAAVPGPAALPVLLAGLAMLGLVRRRVVPQRS
jgi:hypothetical protein